MRCAVYCFATALPTETVSFAQALSSQVQINKYYYYKYKESRTKTAMQPHSANSVDHWATSKQPNVAHPNHPHPSKPSNPAINVQKTLHLLWKTFSLFLSESINFNFNLLFSRLAFYHFVRCCGSWALFTLGRRGKRQAIGLGWELAQALDTVDVWRLKRIGRSGKRWQRGRPGHSAIQGMDGLLHECAAWELYTLCVVSDSGMEIFIFLFAFIVIVIILPFLVLFHPPWVL